MICSKFMFRRRTMFVKKVYNFQVDQVWSVQVGVVETFDHLISDDYVNLLFICWGLFNLFSNHIMAALHTSSVAILLSFFKNFFRSNLMLKQRIAIFVSSHHGRPEGVLRTVLCLHSGTVDNLKWPIGHEYYMITGVTHNYYRLVLISNHYIAKWVVRRKSSWN